MEEGREQQGSLTPPEAGGGGGEGGERGWKGSLHHWELVPATLHLFHYNYSCIDTCMCVSLQSTMDI